MSGISVINDEGGAVVGDVGNLKISTFWNVNIILIED